MDINSLSDLRLSAKLWLKARGLDYAWLANMCYVSESTVRNWMARREIPLAKQDIIRRLITQGSQLPLEVKTETIISIRLTEEIREDLNTRAREKGFTLEEYVHRALTDIANK